MHEMTDDERERKLAFLLTGGLSWDQILAARDILANPKSLIDALLEAGISAKDILDALMEAKAISQVDDMWNADGTETFTYYELKNTKSHVHEPYVFALNGWVRIGCSRCSETRAVPYGFRVEWPPDE
jgi:hypothetical protein